MKKAHILLRVKNVRKLNIMHARLVNKYLELSDFAGGGLMSTIEDLAKYINFMINGNEDVIANNSFREITSPVILIERESKRKIQTKAYALG